MAFTADTDVLDDIVRRRDPSFRCVEPRLIDEMLQSLERGATAEAYLLAAMRLMALPANGHTRLIPNAAIHTVPVRFVSIGQSVVLTDGADEATGHRNSSLVAVNGVPVEEIFARARPYLAGTPARQRAIGAILFAWPGALRELGAGPATDRLVFTLAAPDRGESMLAFKESACVPSAQYYPIREHGAAKHPNARQKLAECTALGAAANRVRLMDFYCPDDDTLETELSYAAGTVLSKPKTGIVFDLRGNPGGDFLRTVPFIDALAEGWRGERYAVLIDKFTFSAAIVFIAILTQKLKGRFEIIGEPMGDDTRFYAEGGTVTLPQTGAAVRYSTAWHDWETGQAADTTPTDIVPHLVAAGTLAPDRLVEMTVSDLRCRADPQLAAARAFIASGASA